MKTYNITIKGEADMLHNRLSRELNKEIAKVPKAKREDWEDENWQKKIYTRERNGQMTATFPEQNMHTMLIDACKKYKVSPPTSIGRTWTSYFKSSVIVSECFPIKYESVKPFGVMVNGNPSSNKKSSKVYKVRPRFTKWSFSFNVIDLEDFLKRDILEDIVIDAGKFIGVGDWRPIFGRFSVVEVKESD